MFCPHLFVVLALFLVTFVAAADLYKILDSPSRLPFTLRRDRVLTFTITVHKSASDRDIRAAYKRLSKKFHPDKNKDPDAEGKFVEIARGESESERGCIVLARANDYYYFW